MLALTHDPLQLGLVLAAAGIPRGVLMLFGGAIADRFSPRILMLVSDLLRFAITGALVAVLAGSATGQLTGAGVAFSIDAVTFLLSAITLWLMEPLPGFGSEHHPLRDVADGLRYVSGNVTIRTLVNPKGDISPRDAWAGVECTSTSDGLARLAREFNANGCLGAYGSSPGRLGARRVCESQEECGYSATDAALKSGRSTSSDTDSSARTVTIRGVTDVDTSGPAPATVLAFGDWLISFAPRRNRSETAIVNLSGLPPGLGTDCSAMRNLIPLIRTSRRPS